MGDGGTNPEAAHRGADLPPDSVADQSPADPMAHLQPHGRAHGTSHPRPDLYAHQEAHLGPDGEAHPGPDP